MAAPGGERRWLVRIAWFIGLWLAGVGTVALVAFAIRKVLL